MTKVGDEYGRQVEKILPFTLVQIQRKQSLQERFIEARQNVTAFWCEQMDTATTRHKLGEHRFSCLVVSIRRTESWGLQSNKVMNRVILSVLAA